MCQIDSGLVCSCKTLLTVIDNIYIGKNADFYLTVPLHINLIHALPRMLILFICNPPPPPKKKKKKKTPKQTNKQKHKNQKPTVQSKGQTFKFMYSCVYIENSKP